MEKVTPIQAPVQSEAVPILEDLLEKAKRGDVSEFMCLHRERGSSDELKLSYTRSDNLVRILGLIEVMKDKVLRRMRLE